tara:strand:+ start:1528 stop:2022 length:495 start_codon:yes stop_codon:yes gene_type:complete
MPLGLMTEIIHATQVAIAIVIGLWIYNRFAKRWTATLGDDVVSGYVNDVGYVASEGGGSILVSYGYSVAGIRFYGAFSPSMWSVAGVSWKTSVYEIEDKMRQEYPKGYEVKVFYFRGSPTEHWLHKPPSKWAIFWKAIWLPAVILVLTNIPLIFINLLIYLQPR